MGKVYLETCVTHANQYVDENGDVELIGLSDVSIVNNSKLKENEEIKASHERKTNSRNEKSDALKYLSKKKYWNKTDHSLDLLLSNSSINKKYNISIKHIVYYGKPNKNKQTH